MSKFHVKKGDTVVVLSGDDAGKSGKVLQVLPKTGRAIVEGLNLVKRHTKKGPKNQQGGIIEQEAPLAVAKLRVSEAEAKPKSAKTAKAAAKPAAEKKPATKKPAAKKKAPKAE